MIDKEVLKYLDKETKSIIQSDADNITKYKVGDTIDLINVGLKGLGNIIKEGKIVNIWGNVGLIDFQPFAGMDNKQIVVNLDTGEEINIWNKEWEMIKKGL